MLKEDQKSWKKVKGSGERREELGEECRKKTDVRVCGSQASISTLLLILRCRLFISCSDRIHDELFAQYE